MDTILSLLYVVLASTGIALFVFGLIVFPFCVYLIRRSLSFGHSYIRGRQHKRRIDDWLYGRFAFVTMIICIVGGVFLSHLSQKLLDHFY